MFESFDIFENFVIFVIFENFRIYETIQVFSNSNKKLIIPPRTPRLTTSWPSGGRQKCFNLSFSPKKKQRSNRLEYHLNQHMCGCSIFEERGKQLKKK